MVIRLFSQDSFALRFALRISANENIRVRWVLSTYHEIFQLNFTGYLEHFTVVGKGHRDIFDSGYLLLEDILLYT